jgi:ABC-type transport system substrate-binding protein
MGLTAFWVLYAIHDALVKPMPVILMTPSLAESGRSARISALRICREGLKFHNGDPFTADDVKFKLQRWAPYVLHEKVRGGGGGRSLSRQGASSRRGVASTS